MSGRESILSAAKAATCGPRESYGDVHENMTAFAHLVEAYINSKYDCIKFDGNQTEVSLSAEDGAWIMVLLKMSRTFSGNFNVDNYVDGSAYVAMAGECADIDA